METDYQIGEGQDDVFEASDEEMIETLPCKPLLATPRRLAKLRKDALVTSSKYNSGSSPQFKSEPLLFTLDASLLQQRASAHIERKLSQPEPSHSADNTPEKVKQLRHSYSQTNGISNNNNNDEKTVSGLCKSRCRTRTVSSSNGIELFPLQRGVSIRSGCTACECGYTESDASESLLAYSTDTIGECGSQYDLNRKFNQRLSDSSKHSVGRSSKKAHGTGSHKRAGSPELTVTPTWLQDGKMKKNVRRTVSAEDTAEEVTALLSRATFRHGVQHIKYYWDKETRSPNIQLFLDGSKCRRVKVKQSMDGVRGALGFRTGKHIFEFLFNDTPWGTHCNIGVVRRASALHLPGYSHLIGCDSYSWGWDIPSRQLLHDGRVVRSPYPSNDVIIPKAIIMTLNMEEGSVSFHINGRELGVAFSGITTELQGHEVYPAVACVYGNTEIQISMLDSSFLVKRPKLEDDDDDTEGDVTTTTTTTGSSSRLSSPIKSKRPSTKSKEPKILNRENMTEDQEYIMERAHSWEYIRKPNCILRLMPNDPCTFHMPRQKYMVLNDNVQSIRCRRGFTKGVYKWVIKERQIVTGMAKYTELDCRHNDLIIGVATSGFFDTVHNDPDKLHDVNELYGWRHLTRLLYSGTLNKNHYYGKSVSKPIRARTGITVVLDLDRHELSFEYNGQNLGVAFSNLQKGPVYYPIALVVQGFFPTSIQFLDGPSEYVVNFLHEINQQTLTSSEYQTLLGYLSHAVVFNDDDSEYATDSIKTNFGWDRDTLGHSTGLAIHDYDGRKVVPKGDTFVPHGKHKWEVVAGRIAVCSGYHEWTYTFDETLGPSDHYIIGVVHELYFDQHARTSNPELFLWGWDLANGRLFHGTELLAKYPIYPTHFSINNYYRLMLCIEVSDNPSIGFSSVAPGIPMDLGAAFENLPDGKFYPCVMYKKGSSACKLEYIRGPEDFIKHHSTACRGCIVM